MTADSPDPDDAAAPTGRPAISIITAVWNRRSTIGDAMASLSRQTYRDYEHVVVDGGSTDGTLDVIAAVNDPRVRLASGPDAGIYDALNKGFDRARGDVIGLLHSDDLLAGPDVLSRVAEGFADPDVDAVYGDLDYVAKDDPSRTVRKWRSAPFRPAMLARGWMPPHPALFLRRRVIERHGGFDTSFRIAADFDLVLRTFGAPGFRAVHVPEVFVLMRLGGASNGSLGRIMRKSAEDYRALRKNGIGGGGALAWKNLSKLGQFL